KRKTTLGKPLRHNCRQRVMRRRLEILPGIGRMTWSVANEEEAWLLGGHHRSGAGLARVQIGARGCRHRRIERATFQLPATERRLVFAQSRFWRRNHR